MELTNVMKIAHIAYEVNAAFCRSLGDNSQPAWEDAEEWQRKKFINGVIFHLHDPEATPGAIHENWLIQKEGDGWGFGEVRDPENKEHPSMLPFVDLPMEQKAKEYIFAQLVRSVAEEYGRR